MRRVSVRTVLFAVAAGAVAPAALSDERPSDVKVTEVWARDLDPQTDGRTLVYSKGGDHVAYRAKREKGFAMILDGKESPTYDDVAGLAMSTDGSRVAHWGLKGKTWHLVVDGKERPVPGKPHYVDGTTLRFGPGGRHLAGSLMDDRKFFVLAGDAVEGPFDLPVKVSFSPDGARFSYFALRDGKSVHAVDGKEQEHALAGKDESGVDVVFAADGARVAFVGRRGEQEFAVVDGKAQGPYQEVQGLSIGPAGGKAVYAAERGPWKWVAVVDGTPGPEYHLVSEVALSPDGKRVAYAARTSFTSFDVQSWTVVVDGKPGPEVGMVRMGGVGFSPDGSRVRYVARKGKGWVAVVDGKEGEVFDAILGAFAFSPDGKRFAHWGRRGKSMHLVVDGKTGKAYEQVGEIEFGPGGALVVAQAFVGGKPALLVGEREVTGLGDAVFPPTFEGPRTLRALSVVATSAATAKIRLLRIEIPAGP